MGLISAWHLCWEYAARAGTTGPAYGPMHDIAWYTMCWGDRNKCYRRTKCARGQLYGDDRDQYYWGTGQGLYGTACEYDFPKPVGMKMENPWGLYDMLGNIPEFTWGLIDIIRGPDIYAPKSVVTDPYPPSPWELRRWKYHKDPKLPPRVQEAAKLIKGEYWFVKRGGSPSYSVNKSHIPHITVYSIHPSIRHSGRSSGFRPARTMH